MSKQMLDLDELDLDMIGVEADETTLEHEDKLDDPVKKEEPAPAKEEEKKDVTKPVIEEDKTVENEDTEEEDEDEELGLIDTLKDRFGYDFGEEVFENTEEGLLRLTEVAATRHFESIRARYVTERPEAARFLEYLEAGGDPSKYIQVMAPEVNYLEVEKIGDNDTQLQERLVKEDLKLRGISDERINQMVSSYRTAGILHEQSTLALETLQDKQKKEQTSLLEKQKEQSIAAQKEREKYFADLEDMVKKAKEIQGLPLSEKDKPDFVSFIRPNKDTGVSPYAEKVKDLTPEQILAVQYLVFKGFDIKGFVNRAATTQRAKTLDEQLKKGATTLNSKRGGKPKKPEVVSIDNLDLGDD